MITQKQLILMDLLHNMSLKKPDLIISSKYSLALCLAIDKFICQFSFNIDNYSIYIYTVDQSLLKLRFRPNLTNEEENVYGDRSKLGIRVYYTFSTDTHELNGPFTNK